MERRKFLQLSALSSASTLFLNGQQIRAFSQTDYLNQIPTEVVDGRSIVLIQLLGGNDGLNTLIPLNQYDSYAAYRPTIKLKNSGGNAAVNLDSSLDLDNQILIHPALLTFKQLYEEGKLNIVQGVGYPNPTKSHFTGRALMFKGADGNIPQSSGWMARYLHAAYEPTEFLDPLGIQLGSKKPSLGFHSEHEHKVDINLTGQNVSGYYNQIQSIGNPKPTHIPDSDYGHNIQFISDIEKGANNYSKRISEIFDKGTNSGSYPDHDLADQLKTVARLIKGGSKTKIFLVSTGGYDTHAAQVESEEESHNGNHAELLKELGESVIAFQKDMEALGIDEKVVSVTFTEFGRKPKENGNLGTDHGNLGPMFVIGKHVNGGITGNNLDLADITKDHFNLTQTQFDYRQVFTTLISDYLGANDSVVDATEFSDFGGIHKLDLIQSSHKADGNLSVEDFTNEDNLQIFPNPIQEFTTIKFNSSRMFRGHIVLYSMQGNVSFAVQNDFKPGINVISLNSLEGLSEGIYILAIKDNYNSTVITKKIIKQ